MSEKGVEEAEAMLRQEFYSPEELSRLLDMSVYVIQEAVYRGDLKATVVDHHILEIRRSDVLDWLATRG